MFLSAFVRGQASTVRLTADEAAAAPIPVSYFLQKDDSA
jgi:hypothetical protein